MQPQDPEHHPAVLLDQVKLSCTEDSSTSLSLETQETATPQPTTDAESKDDQPLNGDVRYLSPVSAASSGGQQAGALLVPTSRSISVTSIEGDPPDVEEDRDFYETEDLGGEMRTQYMYVHVHS